MVKTIPKRVVKQINKKLLESLDHYKKMLGYMGADLPIGSLCLPKRYEKVLLDNGILRIYELFDRDLAKIEGIGKVGVRHLTAGLDQFLSMR